ncbi:uncharacterized protein PHACADRAFT_202478 [Phanerochaete carnosa HHB-10118-sp]|uniref:Uncharacterized protein n=1 Tax=Phanerochaete carnosa (strain HHB-10118-sp) TaxID=650164 RepID=K5VQ49_PHACS|nr:uncharacterized protein PHACADRAFT_202478 [Phanerochaete carnosa HHB-10118-sp]EKM48724.1 hypothetical protein PHACADRAFT_202478 [Phanerochaete carnosa HHB-10118-sp]
METVPLRAPGIPPSRGTPQRKKLLLVAELGPMNDSAELAMQWLDLVISTQRSTHVVLRIRAILETTTFPVGFELTLSTIEEFFDTLTTAFPSGQLQAVDDIHAWATGIDLETLLSLGPSISSSSIAGQVSDGNLKLIEYEDDTADLLSVPQSHSITPEDKATEFLSIPRPHTSAL